MKPSGTYSSAITTLLAFDYGRRRIGVAVGNVITSSANPLTTVFQTGQGPDWHQIEKLVKEWQPELIIVGLPLKTDDTPSDNLDEVKAFADALKQRCGVNIELVDEKLSSTEAREQIKEARQAGLRRRTQAGDIDKFAAQVILRTWLNERSDGSLIGPHTNLT